MSEESFSPPSLRARREHAVENAVRSAFGLGSDVHLPGVTFRSEARSEGDSSRGGGQRKAITVFSLLDGQHLGDVENKVSVYVVLSGTLRLSTKAVVVGKRTNVLYDLHKVALSQVAFSILLKLCIFFSSGTSFGAVICYDV